MTEAIIKGWVEIAKIFDTSLRRMMKHRKELADCGAIFYRIEQIPGTHRHHRVVCSWRSVLINWMMLKAQKGEKF